MILEESLNPLTMPNLCELHSFNLNSFFNMAAKWLVVLFQRGDRAYPQESRKFFATPQFLSTRSVIATHSPVVSIIWACVLVNITCLYSTFLSVANVYLFQLLCFWLFFWFMHICFMIYRYLGVIILVHRGILSNWRDFMLFSILFNVVRPSFHISFG